MSGWSFFDGICGVFCTCFNFYTKICDIKKFKKSQKNKYPPGVLLFSHSAPCPKPALLRPFFDCICEVFCAHWPLSKKSHFCASKRGSAAHDTTGRVVLCRRQFSDGFSHRGCAPRAADPGILWGNPSSFGQVKKFRGYPSHEKWENPQKKLHFFAKTRGAETL